MEEPRIQMMPGAYFCAAAGVLLLPLEWLLSGFLAAAIHECFHFAALKSCRVPIRQLKIGICGAQITTGAMTPLQEIFCAAAGPAGSLALSSLIRLFPTLGFIGLIQGLFNLLPLYPMDGGRILRSIFILAKRCH